ncbi:ABC transporter substrate-binding protein [Micromonospora sp. ATA51]|uniref:ABC transporter substrate-binding protein n=1 Tax=Micromonospora sp. ATA51 TaxID=2806098 RepID=UPI001EE3C5C0|nr:ABC transporter substrate-binding protein [Micromonospora sp. ATA51]
MAAPTLVACGGVSTSGGGGSGALNFLSSQFNPGRGNAVGEDLLEPLALLNCKVAFNPVDPSVFSSTLQSQVDAGKVQVSLVGALHGELAQHASRLIDLDDVQSSLTDRGFATDILELGRLGGSTTKYIPWMQASYVMAINKKALQWLPAGADPQNLTYDQLLAWVTAARRGNGGKPVFGLPCGPKGLYHRFLQGFLLPSFTGGQIATFHSPEAVQAWQFMKELWANTAPASTNYDFMQEPLQRGEVLMAWEHVARVAAAPKAKPDDWLLVPAARGPKGLGYMLVVAGLGIPRNAPEADKAKEAIRALTLPDTQVDVLRNNSFFPVVKATLPSDLPQAVSLEAAAVQKQQNADEAIVSLPPVGLGAKDGEVSQIFQNTFKQICIDRKPIQQVLDSQAKALNTILDELKVPCWKPDPAGAACRVG